MLRAKARNKLPTSEFAGPERSYPIEDRSHAGNAKARAKQQLDAGKLSRAAYNKIIAKANRKLGDKETGEKQDKELNEYVTRKYGPQ
jgi:hypothetical protein